MSNKQPYLLITIDTEEGFDWSKPFTRDKHVLDTLFKHDLYLGGFYAHYNIKPISLVSYPLLNDEFCQRLIKKLSHEKRYIFGTHLHSWVTPPFDEVLSNINSFSHNLPHDLEYAKLKNLTEKFHEVLGYAPIYYKAGRYGIRHHSYEVLNQLGYAYDFSPFAKRDFSKIGGVDFRHIDNKPFFHESFSSIKIFPATADYIGLLKDSQLCKTLVDNFLFSRLKGRALLRKFNLLNFIPLTPESVPEEELKNLTRQLIRCGQTYFHFSYHSSSFTIGGSPYAKTQRHIEELSERIKNYIHFFAEIGGNVHIRESEFRTIT